MFGSGAKITLAKDVYAKVKAAAEAQGASVRDFAEQHLEQEADRVLEKLRKDKKSASAEEVDDITKKLKGLGYLD